MASPELIRYIRKQLAAGVPQDTIRKALIPNGWAAADINEAFAAAMPGATTSLPAGLPRQGAGTKLALSAGLVIASLAYVLFQYAGGQPSAVAAPAAPIATAQPGSASAKSAPPTPAPKPAPAPAPTPAPQPAKPKGMYANGTYTGGSADAYYGTVQVAAVISNGQLADVRFLQYPDTHSTSVYINQQAMPLLTQEAIQAQSANINGVSGATFTSQAFAQSLASALAQAKN